MSKLTAMLLLGLGLTGCIPAVDQNGGGGGGTPDASVPSPDSGPTIDTTALVNEWTRCMKIEDFDRANMASGWGTLAAANGQQCQNCHQGGGWSFLANQDHTIMFDGLKTNRDYLLKYFTIDVPNRKVVINQAVMDGVSKGQAPHQTHPQFDSANNAGATALKLWYDFTRLNLLNNACN